MMTNLFSIFDPSTNIFNMPLNWISMVLILMFIPTSFWMIPNQSVLILNKITLKLNSEFKMLLNMNKYKSTSFLFISLFLMIFINNFLSLFPYIFNSSSHMTFSLSLSLPLWISMMMYGWMMNTNHMFTHLVPLNTPQLLMSFMVLIESISNLIRPGTLAVRLMANMIAGHLLLTLLSSMSITLPNFLYFIVLIPLLMLLVLEIAVSMIQAYVFVTLSTLYSSEVN